MHITVKRHQDIQSEILNELHEIKEMLSSRESSECGCKCHDSIEEQPLTGGIGVIRYSPINTSVFQVSDQISVIISGEHHTATAIEKKGDLTLFLLDDCLETMLPMFDADDATKMLAFYSRTRVSQYLANCVVENPAVACRMVPAKDWYGTIDAGNDKLFLLSEAELVNPGLPWIQTDWKRRIATRCNNPTSYWTRTNILNTTEFTIIDGPGNVTFNPCEIENAIRPAFILRDNIEYKPDETVSENSEELPEELSEDNNDSLKSGIDIYRAISKLEAELQIAEAVCDECYQTEGISADLIDSNKEYVDALKFAISLLKSDPAYKE